MSQALPTNSVPQAVSGFRRHLLHGVARGLALFFAGFTLLNLAGELAHRGFDATLWWIDLRGLPGVLRTAFLVAFAAVLIESVCRPNVSRWQQCLRWLVLTAVLVCVIRDAVSFWWLLATGVVRSTVPIPFSVLVAVGLLTVLLDVVLPKPDAPPRRWTGRLLTTATVVGSLIAFPLMQIYCFGATDYRRNGDIAVVFGCKVYADGRVSVPLANRVRCACRLYHDGLVDRLLMSGGPGLGAIHETHAMRDYAVSLGVPRDRILVDEFGLSTDETVASTTPLLRARGFDRVLAVSHFYHLPRIKLSFHRAGLDVFTVPAIHPNPMRHQKLLLVREVLALWAYYLRPLTGL